VPPRQRFGICFAKFSQPVMTRIYNRILFLILALSLAPAARAAGDGQGSLEIRIKDHREAIGDFSKLTLTFTEILISPKPGLKFWQSGWKSLTPNVQSIDLTKYIGKNSVAIYRDKLPSGSFDAINLRLKQIDTILKPKQRSAPVKNLIGPVKLPFAVQAGGETVIVLDLVVLDMSDHPPNGYELGVNGYELYTNGKLVGKVPPGP
jgi:hypothetical protein